jgi:hypothetical protein
MVDDNVADGLDQVSKLQKIAELTGVTSGKLCSGKMFCISDRAMRNRVKVDEDEKERKTHERAIRQQNMTEKQNNNFRSAATKYFDGRNLRCDDIKVLLKEISVKDDSPMKKKADDLRIQFNNRKHRMAKYAMGTSTNNTTIIEPTAAVLSLPSTTNTNNVGISINTTRTINNSTSSATAILGDNTNNAHSVDSNTSSSAMVLLADTCLFLSNDNNVGTVTNFTRDASSFAALLTEEDSAAEVLTPTDTNTTTGITSINPIAYASISNPSSLSFSNVVLMNNDNDNGPIIPL